MFLLMIRHILPPVEATSVAHSSRAEHLSSLHMSYIWISNTATVYRKHRGHVVPEDGAAAGCGPVPPPRQLEEHLLPLTS